jgi:hypothetical protein
VEFGLLQRQVRADLEDLRETGRIRRADQLSEATGQRFHATVVPQYFVGDLTASMVLVHLNPKQDRGATVPERYSGRVPDVRQYMTDCAHFGRDKYGPESPRTWTSPFDHRQVRYLRAFGVMDFVGDNVPDHTWTNLERVIDNKLQLEVIPYQSIRFSTHGMTPSVLDPHYRQLLDTITASRRDYVIFCGRVLADLLQPWVEREHRFHLVKSDGTKTRSVYRFANLLIRYGGHTVRGGLAPSYARQGIPMTAYGIECASRYS